ncbi:methyl-accepting chemotaxis protein [Pseudomonas sp. HR1]|uniref:Chemotaxis protein n=3 Tax=Pseudomonadaceae TaxID=135621 RepID=A0A1G5NJP9_9PSED|nr:MULTISPECIES: methyl-accepting chemotaxis protein [Pseudomonas]HCV78949.1 chemotaxis protein [Pseudomonas sp.]MBA1260559.1 chemotaxis protein [Pseudomonas psychrotolerans]MBH3330867.1 type IV pili methyl-accepting chemotaxis transducer N-terminal domain-containing protein [Pseudomonas oryzihabitans]MDK4201164.1 methyl-accepting chemotaxis protein [Pseudomonas sp. HR1]MDU4057272.1 methyl-accepting chemotaxis protein [Pseudomonas oryzihabitans]
MNKLNTGKLNAWVAGMFVVLIVAIVLLFANFAYLGTQTNYDNQYQGQATELRILSQQLAKSASEAATGKADAFKDLRQARAEFERRLNILRSGDPQTGLPASPAILRPRLDTLESQWEAQRKQVDTMLGSEQTVLSLHQLSGALADTIPQLQVENEEIVDILIERGAPASQVVVAQRQALLAERILGAINKILTGDEAAVQAADSFGRDASLFGRVLKAMREGNASMGIAKITDPEAVGRLNEANKLFEFVSGNVDEILATSPELLQIRSAVGLIYRGSQALLGSASDLSAGYASLAQSRKINTVGSYLLVFIALGAILCIGYILVRDTRRRLAETDEKNQRNQTAILRLLDEIADLADGDLTVQATVTEDFTGAIADSINYSIDQLRELVETINQTAVQVAAAAQESQDTATVLAEASEHQAQEIAGASAAINEMAVSIDQVSTNASESTAVAERSVAIANKGNQVVHNTIIGMDSIREQIQDTAKRIKRLGESSQEIGDIVGLINDIADQTNILALNAAIQASMAGDAGRGFAVVADEVQRLAERSSGATKQIEALVKAIQTDTNEAVISMEQTTSEVVRGAALAQDAGVALEEIEKVSQSLAGLIQNISNAARQQSSSASHISSTMNVIQEITSQTSAGTTATARSIGELAKLASEMRRSVSGFNLPNEQPLG